MSAARSAADHPEVRATVAAYQLLYVAVSSSTGQSLPHMSRCGPKASQRNSKYFRNRSIVQPVPASVTSPDTLQRTRGLDAAVRMRRAHGSHMSFAISGLAP